MKFFTFMTWISEQFDRSPWILLAVCFAGVYLAYTTDEYHYFYTNEEETCKLQLNKGEPVSEGFSSKKFSEKPSWTGSYGLQVLNALYQNLLAYLPLRFLWSNANPFQSYILTVIRKIRAYWFLYRLKRIATSRRHLLYLLEKTALNLAVKEGETEVDSYLDCKRGVGANWPFMWEVSNVKQDVIMCDGFKCVPMSSYSYLNLIRDDRVQEAAIEAARIWATGNHGPRMLGGNMKILRDLEKTVAKFVGREDSLLCASGYLAALSACVAICTESTVVFADSRLHASLRAGLKLGIGKTVLFKHNNFDDCKELMKKFRHKYQDAWIIVESVYSMDGDICYLPMAVSLAKEYNAQIMIDEAHGLGVLGTTGRGVEEYFGLQGSASIIVGTFSKSIATIGGFIACSKRFASYLDFHAPGNVFSAPLPAYCAGAALKSFEIIEKENDLVKKTQAISKRFRELLETGAGAWPADYPEKDKYELMGDAASTVLPVVFRNDIDRLMRITSRLKEKGYMCSAVAYPACPLTTPRFRLTATAAYTEELMSNFVKDLIQMCVLEKPSRLDIGTLL